MQSEEYYKDEIKRLQEEVREREMRIRSLVAQIKTAKSRGAVYIECEGCDGRGKNGMKKCSACNGMGVKVENVR